MLLGVLGVLGDLIYSFDSFRAISNFFLLAYTCI